MTARDEVGDRAVRLAVIAERLGGETRDLLVEASPASLSGDVVPALARRAGRRSGTSPARPRRSRRGSDALLARDEPFAEAVRHGDRLVLAAGLDRAAGSAARKRRARLRSSSPSSAGRAPGAVSPFGPASTPSAATPSCAVALDDPSLSRTHVRIRVGADTVTLVDAGSRNGTLVEGAAACVR